MKPLIGVFQDMTEPLRKEVPYMGQPVALMCDGKCNKAWGLNSRPKKMLSDNEDDYVFLSDGELGEAPDGETLGTFEGFQTKPSATPLTNGEDMNKWCARECERCRMIDRDEKYEPVDMDDPEPNIRRTG